MYLTESKILQRKCVLRLDPIAHFVRIPFHLNLFFVFLLMLLCVYVLLGFFFVFVLLRIVARLFKFPHAFLNGRNEFAFRSKGFRLVFCAKDEGDDAMKMSINTKEKES